MPTETTNFTTEGRLARADVHYLAFEGGGGKGFAHIGAIQALEELGLLQTSSSGRVSPLARTPDYLQSVDPARRLLPEPIRGIAGSSVGAIMALLLSCGYNAGDIQHIMTRFDFDLLFEPPLPRYVPKIQTDPASGDPMGTVEKSAEVEATSFQGINKLLKAAANSSPTVQTLLNEQIEKLAALSNPSLAPIGRNLAQSLQALHLTNVVDAVMRQIGSQNVEIRMAVSEATLASTLHILLQLAYGSGQEQKVPKPIELLSQSPNSYTAYLREDLGLFAGYEARKLVAELLAFKLPAQDGKPQYNATFLDHYRHFGVTLAVTGTNFETKKGGLFSWKTTPNFPVADAVRISMSMPLIYKPVVIRAEDYPAGYLPEWVNGVWVDGGYLNNIPLHVFDHEEGANPKTLGLRLGISDDQPKPINNISDFLNTWGMFGVWGAGEAHINGANLNIPQTILLDTDGLQTLDFKPPLEARDHAIEKARQDTHRYFES